MVHLDELGEPGLQHRRHAVGQDAPRVLVALAQPRRAGRAGPLDDGGDAQ
jgi:hypothetical protein